MNTNEPTPHNPDNLTPAQYGAPEWRLLAVGDMIQKGDEADVSNNGTSWREEEFGGHKVRPDYVCPYRRRVDATRQPAVAETAQDAGSELAQARAEIERLKEANAVLQSQVDNADVNLEQVRMAQKGIWRIKVESAEKRIAELDASLATERERREKAEAIEKELQNNIQLAANRIDDLKARANHWCDMHTSAAKRAENAESALQSAQERNEKLREALAFCREEASDHVVEYDDGPSETLGDYITRALTQPEGSAK